MADYTAAEIQAAVEKVVQVAVRRPYGQLGNRDVQVTFNDLQQAVASLYILRPNAPFYTVDLGTLRTVELLVTLEEVLVALIEAVENSGRNTKPIDNLAPLANARAALQALESAAAARTGSFLSIEDVPGFKRYDANLQRFLDTSSQNSLKGGEIVPTPEEAKGSIGGLVREVTQQLAAIRVRATSLAGAIDDYDSLDLPSNLSQSVMQQARQVLADRINELEALSPAKRLGLIRDVTLDILAGRAAVKGLGSLRATTVFALLEGAGSVFADASHPAVPAAIELDEGPYPIWSGANEFDFTVDDAFTFTAVAPAGFLAEATSSIAEPYVITAADNDTLLIDVDGFPRVTVALPVGVAVTAAAVVAAINASLGAEPIVAEEVLTNRRFEGAVQLVTGGASDLDFVLPSPSTWESTGAREGDLVKILDSLTGQTGAEYVVDPGGISGTVLTCTQTSGGAPADELGFTAIVTTGVGKTTRIKIKPGEEVNSLRNRVGFVFPNDPANTCLDPALSEFISLGFILGGVVRSRSIDSQTVVTGVSEAFSSQQAGVARIDGTVSLSGDTFLGRTDPDNPIVLIAYKFRSRGDVAAGGPAAVVFSVSGAAGLAEVGDVLVLRETSVQDDQGAFGLVTAVDASGITADLDRAVSADSDVLVETGPNLPAEAYLDLRVSGSSSQDGDYSLEFEGLTPFPGGIPFDLTLEQPVPASRDIGGQPFFFSIELGHKRAVFSSTSVLLDTQLRIFERPPSPLPPIPDFPVPPVKSAVPLVLAAHPVEEVGTADWFQLPLDPKSLAIGDTLELHEASVSVVSRSFELVALELDSTRVQLGAGLETDFGSINLSLNSPVPYARIRLGRKNTFAVLEDRLNGWLALPQLQAAWLQELNRVLNPILSNKRPTLVDIGAARAHVQQLLGVLTESGAASTGADPLQTLEFMLNDYTAVQVPEVDSLVETFLERGSDRGIDLLLQGQFGVFFGLTVESMSFDGHFREAIRNVMRDDLPIRKVNRQLGMDREGDEGSWTDPDYEFDFSDTEDLHENVEIPGDFDEITPPGL